MWCSSANAHYQPRSAGVDPNESLALQGAPTLGALASLTLGLKARDKDAPARRHPKNDGAEPC